MKRLMRVSIRKLLSNLDLSEIETRLYEKYKYKKGQPGRPPQYPAWFREKYRKRVSVERFFYRLKTYLDLKRLNIKGKTQLKLFTYLISIGMLLIAYLNSKTGCSPRSIKSFIRRWM